MKQLMMLITILLSIGTLCCTERVSNKSLLQQESTKINDDKQKMKYESFSSENIDGIQYIPSYKYFSDPTIGTHLDYDTNVQYETYKRSFDIGQLITNGSVYTFKKSLLLTADEQSIIVDAETELLIYDSVPKRINDDYYILCRSMDGIYQGYILLRDVYYKAYNSNDVIIGYIPRYELFTKYTKYFKHANNTDIEIPVKQETIIEYNSLYIRTKNTTYVIEGGSLDQYHSQYKTDEIIPFGLINCSVEDINNDGLTEVIIEYGSILSLEYYGLSTGPRITYLQIADNELYPIFHYSKISGEDIGAYYSYPFFIDTNNDGLKDKIDLYSFYHSDSLIEIFKTVFAFNGYQYIEKSKEDLFSKNTPYSMLLKQEILHIYEEPFDTSVVVGSYSKEDEVIINDFQFNPNENYEKSTIWYRVDKEDGWVKSSDIEQIIPNT